MTKVLIAGATGLVGGEALALALEDDRVDRVIAPTRRPLVPHSKLDNPIVDFDRLPESASWWAVEGAICALGTTRAAAGSAAAFRVVDHDYPVRIARIVRGHGATNFALVSSMGADPRSWFLYPRTKGEVEAAVGELAFPSMTFVRPGLLGGERSEVRALEHVAGTVLRTLGPLLPRGMRISPVGEVARLLVEAVLIGEPGCRVVGSARIAEADEPPANR